MRRLRLAIALGRSTARSIAGRLTIWFTATMLVLLMVKSTTTYVLVSPQLAATETGYVIARAQMAAQRLSDARTETQAMAALEGDVPGGLIRAVLPDGRSLGETAEMREDLADAHFPGDGHAARLTGRSGRHYWGVAQPARYGPGGIPVSVQVAVEASEYRLFSPNGSTVWLAMTFLSILCGVAGYRIARHGIRPLQDFVEATRAIDGSLMGRPTEVECLPTELKPLGENFNAMLDDLHSAFARVSRFSDDIAHELRTPLTIMASDIDVALASERRAPEYRDVLESTRDEISGLAELVHRLLFLSRAENQSVALKIEGLDLRHELIAVQEFYEPLAAESGVALAIEAGATDLRLDGDRVLLQRAIGNLVVNAIHHTPPGGTVTVAAMLQPPCIRIAVTDTGCGIGAEHLPRMFDRFFRVDQARGGNGSVGLGLAIAKAIVALHHGAIEIASTVGEGTTVTITLPQAQDAAGTC